VTQHVDYPLHDMGSPFPPEVVLGAQCNVCIDDFSVSNSTNFIIGSHQTRRPPPAEFNARGNEHFPPYAPQVRHTVTLPVILSYKDTCHSPIHFIIQSWWVLVAGPGGRPD
jgi:hypothetical protein